jgi:hypothetical protein
MTNIQLPPDPEGMNDNRADWAGQAMSDPKDLLASCNDAIPFDNFEVQGVIRRRWSIPVDDTDAEYWTIIGYISGKQICGIGRFASRAEAERFSQGLYRHKRSA